MNTYRIIKIPIASFGIALALFMLLNVILFIFNVSINSGENLNNTRYLFLGCYLVSLPIAARYLK